MPLEYELDFFVIFFYNQICFTKKKIVRTNGFIHIDTNTHMFLFSINRSEQKEKHNTKTFQCI